MQELPNELQFQIHSFLYPRELIYLYLANLSPQVNFCILRTWENLGICGQYWSLNFKVKDLVECSLNDDREKFIYLDYTARTLDTEIIELVGSYKKEIWKFVIKYAALQGNEELVNRCLTNLAPTPEPGKYLVKALINYAKRGHYSLVLSLIPRTIDYIDNYIPYLFYAARGGNMRVVLLFLERMRECKIEKKVADIAMIKGARGGNQEIVDLFVGMGADRWNDGLSNAVKGGHLSVAKFFIGKGATGIKQAIVQAAGKNHREVTLFLLETGKCPVEYLNRGLVWAANVGSHELMEVFEQKGANDWDWALFRAVINGQYNMVVTLVAKGARNLYWALQNVHPQYPEIKDFLQAKINTGLYTKEIPRMTDLTV